MKTKENRIITLKINNASIYMSVLSVFYFIYLTLMHFAIEYIRLLLK